MKFTILMQFLLLAVLPAAACAQTVSNDGYARDLTADVVKNPFGLCWRTAQWTEAADDCVQEALIELARQPRVPENVVAWLYRVVRNRAVSQLEYDQKKAALEVIPSRSPAIPTTSAPTWPTSACRCAEPTR